MTARAWLLSWLVPAAIGCVAGPGEIEVRPSAPFDVFVASVNPILGDRCGNPSCHGSAGRPLELYSIHQHRAVPEDVHLGAPLTQEELERNYLHASAFLVDAPSAEQSMLLRKTLPLEAGGMDHVGGAIFEDPRDVEYRTLARWVGAALRAGEER
jgi:hypothetical protein